MTTSKKRSAKNRTLTVSANERETLAARLLRTVPETPFLPTSTQVIQGELRDWSKILPPAHFDLLFLDPPYNLTKVFNHKTFNRRSTADYTAWLQEVVVALLPLLKATATVYICGDWLTSHSIFEVAATHFIVRNRITWERDKGRGARTNWKNTSEDIWFCTCSNQYTFNVEAVKLRRRVRAPYTDPNGQPKDWQRSQQGNFRDTYPSNLWTDITVPFWSMPENTDHPTQKSEKLLAKLILASTNPGDWILDPFLGSGTTTAVAQKLRRQAVGIESDIEYCLLAQKRLQLAETDSTIQGFSDGVFWERNTKISRR